MNTVLIVWFITIIPYIIYLKYKYKRDLHVLQMNSYRYSRYIRWFRENRRENFRFVELLPLLSSLALLFNLENQYILIIYKIIFFLAYTSLILKRVRYRDKKKLVMTGRARRILFFASLNFGIIVGTILLSYIRFFEYPTVNKLYILVIAEILLLVEFTIASFMPILGANIVLTPIEAIIQKKYYKLAKEKLKRRKNLKIIGITGSYGKTSTKMIVADILSEKFNVCRTPESYNTIMGVVKTINYGLRATDEIFVVEMGAKQKGDIKEICDLVKPQYGILTSIGPQHLESFRTIENTKQAKYELIQSLGIGGKAFLNIDNKYIKEIVLNENINNIQHETICYSLEDEKMEYFAKDIKYSNDGTTFTIVTKGKEFKVKTKLLGIYNVYNILAGVAVASELGMDFNSIKEAIAKIKPVEHRLELKQSQGGITIIDDAFNSNPEGSKMALDILSILKGKRKIIVTPGMIELGDRQYDLNREFGEHCIKVCDYIILVGEKQTLPIQDAIKLSKYNKDNYYVAKDFYAANEHLKTIVKEGDIVLFENDLLEDK